MLDMIVVATFAFAWGWIEGRRFERQRAGEMRRFTKRRQMISLRAASPSEQVRARWN